MLKEFKEFVMRGNVLDLAVAVIIGGAFGKIISSLVNDILKPPRKPGKKRPPLPRQSRPRRTALTASPQFPSKPPAAPTALLN